MMAQAKKHFGAGMDRMPGWAFRGMACIFSVRDRFFPVDSLLEKFPIKPGMAVADYGCGPGSYIRRASAKVGPQGLVYAIDVHELAVAAIEKKIQKENLTNVKTVLAQKDVCPLEDGSVDLVWALDMFHMVSQPTAFLKELNRITKPDGNLFIDDGHQPRAESKAKIQDSGAWRIIEETPKFMKCAPIR